MELYYFLLFILSLRSVSCGFKETNIQKTLVQLKGLPEILENDIEPENPSIVTQKIEIPPENIPILTEPKYLDSNEHVFGVTKPELESINEKLEIETCNRDTSSMIELIDCLKNGFEERLEYNIFLVNKEKESSERKFKDKILYLEQELGDLKDFIDKNEDVKNKMEEYFKDSRVVAQGAIANGSFDENFEIKESTSGQVSQQIIAPPRKYYMYMNEKMILVDEDKGTISIDGKETALKEAPKMENTFQDKTNTNIIYIACQSEVEAEVAVLKFGGEGICNTPIEISHTTKENPFPYFSLGNNNRKIVVSKDGKYYDYRFYHGMNDQRMFARIKPGCEQHEQYYSNDFKVFPKRSKLKNFFNQEKKQHELFVACKTRNDAYYEAMNHKKNGYYDTPIQDPPHKPKEFPHFHLGRKDKRKKIYRNGISYNYHYYFDVDSNGKIAREEPGCDKPVPYLQ